MNRRILFQTPRGHSAATLLLAAVVSSGCPGTVEPGDQPALKTDLLKVELTREDELLEASVPYTFTNRTGGPVYLLNCNGSFELHLEREKNGRWIVAWSPIMPDCLSQPIVIEEGEVWIDTVEVAAGMPGSNFYPQFDVANPSGTYRIVWIGAYSSYDPGGPPWGRQLSSEYRFSNTFQLVLPLAGFLGFEEGQ